MLETITLSIAVSGIILSAGGVVLNHYFKSRSMVEQRLRAYVAR